MGRRRYGGKGRGIGIWFGGIEQLGEREGKSDGEGGGGNVDAGRGVEVCVARGRGRGEGAVVEEVRSRELGGCRDGAGNPT
jgi:hypothetical protein